MRFFNSTNNFPSLDLGEYTLREHQDKDLESFFRYYTDPEVSKFILTETPRNIEEARHELYYWKNVFYEKSGIYFTIADKNNDQMIGSIGLTSYNAYHNRIELSYDLAKEFWRKGITFAAVKEVIKFGFKVMNINRIEATTSVYNEGSIRLLEKCNFQYEGRLRQYRYHRGKLVDVYIFSMIKEEFIK